MLRPLFAAARIAHGAANTGLTLSEFRAADGCQPDAPDEPGQ